MTRILLSIFLSLSSALAAQAAPFPEILKAPRPAPACAGGVDCKCKKAGHNCDCNKGQGCDCVLAGQIDRDYGWLPPVEVCTRHVTLAEDWAWGVLWEAKQLGYYGPVWVENENIGAMALAVAMGMGCGLPPPAFNLGDQWHTGGGPHAAELQREYAETKQRARVWRIALGLRLDSVEHLPRLERELRDLIGDAAFFSGNLPPSIPLWRVPRSR